MNVNLSSRSLLDAYNQVVSGDPNTSWTIFTYDRGTNDLKVQDSGSGGLEEVADEFRDGRIQYAFVRVVDPNSELPKFVQINWCGDGVPEGKKGLFHNHSNTVARFLKAAHIQINARNESDVDPSVILKRLADAGGSKYSIQEKQAPPPKPDRIGAVGSSYVPTGKIDMNQLKAGSKSSGVSSTIVAAPTKTPYSYTTPAPAPKPASSAAPVAPPTKTVSVSINDDETWGEEPPAAPAPRSNPSSFAPSVGEGAKISSPAATSFYKPPPAKATPAVASAPTSASAKPEQEDKIGPVGTAYTPVSLPAPKKLINRWGAPAQQASSESSSPTIQRASGANIGGEKKLTWSERQAIAKAQDAEDEKKSQAASAGSTFKPVQSLANSAPPSRFTPPIRASQPSPPKEKDDDGFENPEPVPAPVSRALPPRMVPRPTSDDDDDGGFEEPDPTPAPVSAPALAPRGLPPRTTPASSFTPPAPPRTAFIATSDDKQDGDDDDGFEDPDPTPAPSAPARTTFQPPRANQPPAFPSDDEFASEDEADKTPAVVRPAVNDSKEVEETREPEKEKEEKEEPKSVFQSIKETLVGKSEPESEPVPAGTGGLRAKALFDYEATEDNELGFNEGDVLVEVDQVDEGWWSAKGPDGRVGLFPANYVELIEEEERAAPVKADAPAERAVPAPPLAPEPKSEHPVEDQARQVAVALYDYDAAEENEITFKEGDRITHIDAVSDDWWSGTAPDGTEGLFPSNYVEVQQ
ncbi:Drebrins and related actin binding proteins [Phaffia rhodozyma]|uniref:Drebrins and related actin binding proteins n=1 Tax=Phaffia rhodozyma TaxID=264483 RepID=A0A0F7SLZ2_PHARH|nr:Drebrins and related actin binding proteins [Phaffia rhodozyma]